MECCTNDAIDFLIMTYLDQIPLWNKKETKNHYNHAVAEVQAIPSPMSH